MIAPFLSKISTKIISFEKKVPFSLLSFNAPFILLCNKP